MVRIKICGITNFDDAYAAFRFGADAIGFIFYQDSPRYIEPQKAREISFGLPPFISKIGVFVNASFEEIMSIAKFVGLTGVQMHGEESPKEVEEIRPFYPVIKVFPVETLQDVGRFLEYTDAIPLFDTKTPLKGGSGKTFNWHHLEELNIHNAIDFFIVAGGINEGNVEELIRRIRPPMIDISSGVEVSPGKKDHDKMFRLIRRAKGLL
jgi:phosphoribosylanthranilate isomerase